MDLNPFRKKETLNIPLDKRMPLGPPNLSAPEEHIEEEESNISEQVGFPSEQYEAPQQEQETESGFVEDQGEESYPGEQMEPPPGELPSFLPPPPGYQPAEQAPEAAEEAASRIASELKADIDEKLNRLSEDLGELKKMDSEIKRLAENFEDLNKKFEEIDEKVSSLPIHAGEDIAEIKAVVNNLNQIMGVALPALIKEVRSLKEKR